MDPNAANFDPRGALSYDSNYGAMFYEDVTINGYGSTGTSTSGSYWNTTVPGEANYSDGSEFHYTLGGDNVLNSNQEQYPTSYYVQDYHADMDRNVDGESVYYNYHNPKPGILSVPHSPNSFAPGTLYPIESIRPQLLFGAPVSALAYDISYEALFVASETQSLSRGRVQNRASMLLTHSTVDGMLYSSVAGHPEAPTKVLKALYHALYYANTPNPPPSSHTARKIPKHAFRPMHGSHDLGIPDSTQSTYQLGIQQLLPLGGGYVSSVSPAAVRIHSYGGLQTADFHTEGMLCITSHPNHDTPGTHLSVGGMGLGKDVSDHSGASDLLCLDLWHGLRVVASYSTSRRSGQETSKPAIVTMATSHSRGSIIAGCSDGSIRILDGRLREIAKLKSHLGGVVKVAVSDDGNLMASTGFGSRGSSSQTSLYSFPDPNIGVYDLRYLGRGGISHPFVGLKGGPRFISFLPPMKGHDQPRLLAASGQVGGGLQIVLPFQGASSADPGCFIIPQLDRGESITAMQTQEDRVGLGTSKGNILQYRVAPLKDVLAQGGVSGVFVPPYASNLSTLSKMKQPKAVEKEVLQLPPFEPPLAQLSIDPTILIDSNEQRRNGINHPKSSISSLYTLGQNPKLTPINYGGNLTFGFWGTEPMVAASKNEVSDSFLAKSKHSVDFVLTVPASGVDLLRNHQTEPVTKQFPGRMEKKKDHLPNPNKLLYDSKLFEQVYKESCSRSKKRGQRTRREAGDAKDDHGLFDIPPRYRLSIRPTQKTAGSFSHAEHNTTNLFPGWDYPPTMPNAFVPPVIMLLYFIPEARRSLLRCQFADKVSLLGRKDGLVTELSFLFHQIDSLARYAMIFKSSRASGEIARLGAWCPSNFVASLASMPEAEQLQILDGSPAAVETPRRPEAFYRFLFYQIDKELGKGANLKLMDRLGGVDFVSVNEFNSNSTPPTTSSTRAMTVDLYYEPFLMKGSPTLKKRPTFGEVLLRTFSRETPLRAFNESSGCYETIVQRKIAVALPKLLSLSCACAGRKESDGLFVWRGNGQKSDCWLPESLEIEITQKGNILVRELVRDVDTGKEEWITYGKDDTISNAVSQILAERKGQVAQKVRYELFAVISMVRDELDRNIPDEMITSNNNRGSFGHHILHVRVPRSHEKQVISSQKDEIATFLSGSAHLSHSFALVNGKEKDSMEERLRYAEHRLEKLGETNDAGGWILFNGFKVSKTSGEDARAFDASFKEPCIVVFRCQEESEAMVGVEEQPFRVPHDVICTRSLTNNMRSNFFPNQKVTALPGPGDLVAFDAEFVSVQEEVSTLTEMGCRVTIQETRHAMARISAIVCQTRTVLFDDFVLPQERVADYLTRFSGIVERDLNPKESERHLITTRAAYLKLRCLVERRCIFVGHGLSRDFWIANLTVPGNQIIDTVEIYHKPAQRYVSLRFLTNFILKRDMQQEVHDSMEDATAAFELYERAVELQQKGEFSKMLDDLYEYGQKVDWKLGIA